MNVLVLQLALLHKTDGIPSESSATYDGGVEFVLLLQPECLDSDPLLLQDMGLQPTLWSTVLDNHTHSAVVPTHTLTCTACKTDCTWDFLSLHLLIVCLFYSDQADTDWVNDTENVECNSGILPPAFLSTLWPLYFGCKFLTPYHTVCRMYFIARFLMLVILSFPLLVKKKSLAYIIYNNHTFSEFGHRFTVYIQIPVHANI
jgi:hypothetical protein